MIVALWLSAALAADPACDPTTAVTSLRAAESLRASYLCLAVSRDLSLLSLDDALVRAAGKRAVRLRS